MEFNGIVFPSPKFNYAEAQHYMNDELFYIPRPSTSSSSSNKKDSSSSNSYIPCLYLQDISGRLSKNFLIFFHGNAEDIFQARTMADKLRNKLYMNVLLVEYPGYSIYINIDKNSDTLLENTKIVYDFIKSKFNLSDKNIFVFGRSIGTSPAIYLSSQRRPNALFVVSAFSTINAVAKHLVGPLSVFLKERFKSIEYIQNVKCPTLLIHGQSDPLIPFTETLLLKEKCNCPYQVSLPEEMTHNEFDLDDDIINPIKNFMNVHCVKDMENNNWDLNSDEFKVYFDTPEFVNKLVKENKNS